MSNYQILFSLCDSLTKTEVKLLKKKFDANNANTGLLKKIFDLVVLKDIRDTKKLSIRIYGEDTIKSNETLRKLAQRLIDEIFDIITLEENFYKDYLSYSDVFHKRMFIIRRILLLQVLMLKGLPKKWLIKYLHENITICEQYEYIEFELVFRHSLFQIYLEEDSYQEALDCASKIADKSHFFPDLIKAEYYGYDFIVRVQHKSIDDRTQISKMKSAIIELENLYIKSRIEWINYYILMLKLQLAHYEEDYFHAEQLIYMLIDVVGNNPGINFKSKRAVNFMNLAYTQFYLNKFSEAYENSIRASEVILLPVIDLNTYAEVSVFALFYLNKFSDAESTLNRILLCGASGNKPEQLSKRHLMMGFIKYLQGDYKKAFLHLQETKEVESDREGWNLGIRILNIYLTLSTEKVDLADQRINAMRKHIERTARMRNLRKRDIVIFRILSHLSRSGFDFREVWEERQKDFQLLRSDESDYRWVPRSHELIIFDQWFEARVFGKKYVPVFPAPRISAEGSRLN